MRNIKIFHFASKWRREGKRKEDNQNLQAARKRITSSI